MIGKLRTLLEEAVELEIELQCLFLKTLAREPFHSLLLTLNWTLIQVVIETQVVIVEDSKKYSSKKKIRRNQKTHL